MEMLREFGLVTRITECLCELLAFIFAQFVWGEAGQGEVSRVTGDRNIS